MNLRDLTYLVALAETRHFGRAARQCHVSQPTLSAQIKKLEAYLGVQLVERQRRRILLTDAGREVVARAREVVAGADQIVDFARHLQDAQAGALSVAFIPTLGPYLMPRIVPVLRKRFPRLELTLSEHKTADALEQLKAGHLDVAVMALPHGEAAGGLAERALFDEPFVAAVPSDHALARRRRLAVADLAQERLLLLQEGHCLRDQALAVCALGDSLQTDDFRATSLETLRQMVAAGAGVTLLPALAAEGPFARDDTGVAIRAFRAPPPVRTIGAVWRQTSGRIETIDSICDTIADVMSASTATSG